MTHFSSAEPIVLQKDQVYELISVYNNPTDSDIDAMAMFYYYFENEAFQAPPVGAPS